MRAILLHAENIQQMCSIRMVLFLHGCNRYITVSPLFYFQQLLEAVVKDDRRLCYVLLIHSTAEDVNLRSKDSKNLTSLHISCKLGNAVITQLILWVSNILLSFPFF